MGSMNFVGGLGGDDWLPLARRAGSIFEGVGGGLVWIVGSKGKGMILDAAKNEAGSMIGDTVMYHHWNTCFSKSTGHAQSSYSSTLAPPIPWYPILTRFAFHTYIKRKRECRKCR